MAGAPEWRRRLHAGDRGPTEGSYVSIVRIGLAETNKFAEGYDAIFGKTRAAAPAKKPAKKAAPKTKKAAPKKTTKKTSPKKK